MNSNFFASVLSLHNNSAIRLAVALLYQHPASHCCSEMSSPTFIALSAYHLEKPFSRASLIHECRHLSTASGTVNQVLVRVLISGHDSSSSLTNKANIAALHKPSGLNSSWWVLLLKS